MQYKYILGVLFFLSCLIAAPNNGTNLLKAKTEIQKIMQTSLPEVDPLFDTVQTSKEKFAVFAPVENQSLIVQLKHPFYIRQIRIYTDKKQAPKTVFARHSRDSYDWVDFADVKVEETNDSRVFVINGENSLANYLSINFTAGPGTEQLIIQEIEVFPQMDLRLRPYHIKDKWQTTDTEAFNEIDTKIDVFKFWTFSEVGAPANEKFKLKPSPALEGEIIGAGNLKPGTLYEYKMSLTDYNGNILDLPVRQFSTKPKSFALKALTEGTFSNKGSAAVDGSMDIQKGGSTMSGSVADADQYLIIDLGSVKQISEVVTIWRQLSYPKDFTIQVSNDKKNWTTVKEHLNVDVVTTARSAEGHPIKCLFTDFPKAPARYIKLLIPKGSALYSKHNTQEVELIEVKAF